MLLEWLDDKAVNLLYMTDAYNELSYLDKRSSSSVRTILDRRHK